MPAAHHGLDLLPVIALLAAAVIARAVLMAQGGEFAALPIQDRPAHCVGLGVPQARLSKDRLDRDAEEVADAALGADVLRLRRMGLQLAAQPHHLDVHGSVVDVVDVQAGELEQLLAAEYPFAGLQQRDEQAVKSRTSSAIGTTSGYRDID